MTLDLGEDSVKFRLCASNRLQDIMLRRFLENGRFDLENVGQGQLVIQNFSYKNKPKKVRR